MNSAAKGSVPSRRIRRIAFVGHPGAGKTTSALFGQRISPGSAIISVASPLKEIEQFIYQRIGLAAPSLTGIQDGRLQQELRRLILERRGDFLERDFSARIAFCREEQVIFNDDCRLAMYKTLHNAGFVFVWVDGDHLRRRGDLTRAESTGISHDAVILRDHCTHVIDNTGSIRQLFDGVARLLTEDYAQRATHQ